MSRKLLSLFAILFIISAISPPVYADQTVFGPKDLKIGRWHVHLSSHRFTVDDPSDGVLTIVKNTPDKNIRGGFCFLNGKYIGLRNFLKGTGTIFEKDVDLRSNNRMIVFLRGTPKASIKIEVNKKGVTPPPEITFTAEPTTIYVGQSSTLSWTSANTDTCVIEPGIGSVDLNGSTTVSPTETTVYTITATGLGGTATANATVAIANSAPVANDQTVTLNEDETASIILAASDANSDPLTYQIVTGPAHGTLTGSAPNLTYTPSQNYNGSDTFTFKANDGSLDSNTATVTLSVQPLNDPPTAVNDFVTTDEDTAIAAVAVLTNDSDPDGDTLTIDDSTQPAHGAAGSNGDGTLTYTPDLNYNGNDSFTYTISDGNGGTATATVNITINSVNDAPVANDQTVTLNEDETASITLTASDADGDTLTYQIVSNPSHGTLTGSAPDLTYTPSQNYNGLDSFTFTVNDGTIDSNTAAINITIVPVNDPPMAVDDTIATDVNTPVITGNVLANDTDPEGDTLTISDFTQPVDGSVINNGDNTFAYTPNNNFHGTDSFTYTIEDGNGGSGTASVIITVAAICGPVIKILEPDGVHDIRDCNYKIRWIDTDENYDGTISLYYDTDNIGADGTLIVSNLNESPDGPGDNEYEWDISAVAEGSYYVYAVLENGVDDPVVDYSDGMVTIDHNIANEFKITASDASAGDLFGNAVSISGDYAIVGAWRDDLGGLESGSVYFYKREGFTWTEQTRFTRGNNTYGDFGSSVCMDGEYAIVGAPGENGGWNYGSVYLYKRDGFNWIEQIRIYPNISSDSYFGNSVSINGDYAAVGAYQDDYVGSRSGSAYVYLRDGSNWNYQAKLSPSDAAASDYFGTSISISGDYIIVGARGSAYIFKRDGTTWTEETKIDYNSNWGTSVYIDGDYAIVGAPGSSHIYKRDGSNWPEEAAIPYGGYSVALAGDYAIVKDWGASYVFKREGTSWLEKSRLEASNTNSNPCAVSITDNYCIVGHYGSDDHGTDSGSAYIYSILPVHINAAPETVKFGESTTLSWYSKQMDTCEIAPGIGSVEVNGSITVSPAETTTYIITATGPEGTFTDEVTVTVIPNVSFTANPEYIILGDSSTLTWTSVNADTVSIDNGIGNVDLNGSIPVSPTAKATTYTITAIGPGGTATESVTVNVLDNGLLQELKFIGRDSYNYFGNSVSLSGDYAIVGAYGDRDSGEGYSGAAYILKREDLGWIVQSRLRASDPSNRARLGYSVAINGNLAMAAAYSDDKVYVYSRDGSEWIEQAILEDSDPGRRHFGQSIAMNENYAIIASLSGAYIFKRECSTWIEQAKLNFGVTIPYNTYGHTVSITNDYAIIGINNEENGGVATGSAYIFKREGTTWIEEAHLTASDAAAGDQFGYSVCINGDYAIVGADRNDAGGTDSGSAYIFKREGSNWTQQAQLIASDAGTGDYFGYSASIIDGYAVIGAVGNNDGGENSGSVYVFKRKGSGWTQQAKITASDKWAYDLFGSSVAISGDDIIVGAPADDSNQGAAYIYSISSFPPDVEISASPETIEFGETATLSWTSNHADTCIIEPDIGSVDLNGSISVSPTETTTYTITATGPHGTDTDSITVTVTYQTPIIEISANPEIIALGDAATLTWSSAYASSVSIDKGIGNVDLIGSMQVAPKKTTTYRITATNPGGTATAKVTVRIENEYYCGDPTHAEQAHLEAINRTRLNPSAEASRLGIDLNEGLPPGTISEDPVEPLTFNDRLYEAAFLHSQDMIQQQYYGHNSLDGRTPPDRVLEAGYQFLATGENIGYRTSTMPLDEVDTTLEFHDRLFIDEGVGGRGHRKNILSINYKEVGLSPAPGSYDGYPYCYMFTCDFGSSSTLLDSFLLGVAYDDQNSNGAYDAGEGIENVSIVITETGEHTWTATAGGYGIPLAPGTYTVEATLPDGRGTSRQVIIADQNIKLDFLSSDFSPLTPTVSITAQPESIIVGESTLLSWDSTHAYQCVIEPGIGTVPINHTMTVSPDETTTYTITATGPGGTVSDSVTVEVNQPSPIVSITANPENIQLGESSTLTWNSTNVTSCVIEPGIGNVDLNGSITVSPTETTEYIITGTGPGGLSTSRVTVGVYDPTIVPTAIISATPASITQGESATLSWSSTNASSAYIDNGVGYVNVDGSITVSPDHTTTYTITVNSAAGSASAHAVLKVLGEPDPIPEGSFGKQYEDLIPDDVTLEEYDPERFAIITGLVNDISGASIEGVSITIKDNPQYGTAYTGTDGRFIIPVNGGGIFTVVYIKEGEYISTHRKVDTPWNDIAVAETAVMVALDLISTTVTFDGNPNTVISHTSSVVADEFGSRAMSMVFTGDNRAYSVNKDGEILQELNTITTRATEFSTPESMPAILPPTTFYTYCAELSVDGIERVRFDKPVVTWVDNFLGFDVGEIVPSGYYDRDRGVWVPSENGVVVKLLDTDSDGIVDALDSDGDDQPDDLNEDGSFSDEVIGLEDAGKYAPDAVFWRVAVTHFTPWDYNYCTFKSLFDLFNYGNPNANEQENNCKTKCCSFITERSRIAHDDIAIPGTDITLHYAGNRVEGYKTHITVPAVGTHVPSGSEIPPCVIKRVIVKVEVAGKTFEQILDPLPNQKAEFLWDGLDFLGRPVSGTVKAEVNIGFVYDSRYMMPYPGEQVFAYPGTELTEVPARDEVISWNRSNLEIHRVPIDNAIAKGWTISSQHFMSPSDNTTLYKGNGFTQNSGADTKMIDTVAGNGVADWAIDGVPATESPVSHPSSVVFDAAGNMYIASQINSAIRKVDRDGMITTIAGGTNAMSDEDDISAVNAIVRTPNALAIDTEGNLYFADSSSFKVRKIDVNGMITTVAGDGTDGDSGDGGLATEAQIYPTGVAVDASGNIYIADYLAHRVRKVDTNGIINTVAGNGTPGLSSDNQPAIYAQLEDPFSVAVDSDENLFISAKNVIRKVDTSGTIRTVAGIGIFGYSGDGGLATLANIGSPYSVAFDRSGNFYFSQVYGELEFIRRVDINGNISTVAGIGQTGYTGDGGPPTRASLNHPRDIAFDPSGNMYIPDFYNNVIRKVGPPASFKPGMLAGEITIAGEDGLEHVMSSTGRHLETIDLETKVVIREFGYNAENQLVSITDQFNNQTVVERDSSGIPTAIISPDGIRTELSIDANNQLVRVTYPDQNYFGFEYGNNDGLLTAKNEPAGNRFEHVFDQYGRVTDATDEEGGHWQFSMSKDASGETLYVKQTGEGNVTSYLDHTYSYGLYTSTITDPTGAGISYEKSGDGLSVRKLLPCGMGFNFEYTIDQLNGFTVIKEISESTPTGLNKVTLRDKAYEDTDSDEIPDLITETVMVNNKNTTLVNNVLQSQKTVTTPEGRTVTTQYDPASLLTEFVSIPGLNATNYGYNPQGKITSVSTGTRETTFSYDAQGFMDSFTDPEGYTTTYAHDAVGRVTGVGRPDGSSLGYTYDGNGNMTVLTNPSSIQHGFGFNAVNLNSSYQTPISGTYSYVYDRDRRLVQTNFPSGSQINNVYNTTQLTQVQTPEGNIDYTYLCGTMVDTITKGTEAITFGYDGKLVTSESLSGTLNQSLIYTYNNDFNVTGFTYAGDTESYTYDNDGLLTGAGSFTITRNAQNGLPEALNAGVLSQSRTFNGYEEQDGQASTISGQGVSSWSLAQDDNGQITQKIETIDGTTSNYVYTYDPMGRLITVTIDGSLVEEYDYDINSTRNYEMNTLRGIAGRNFTYSDEDHLLTAGTTSYQYDVDGFLTTKTDGTDVTTYNYSSRGELLSVTLPDGRFIEYVHDPLGRRIAKIIDGTTIEKYLWQGLTRLLAVYDGSNNLIMRFEYADGRMPVAMTRGGATYYLTYDQVGSLRVVADGAGNVVKRIDYDSFGNIIDDTDPSFDMPFGFAGGLHDRDTGLVRFGYRDYDPDIGRWTAKDPILFAGGDTDLFGYCLNNPVNWVDPEGLWGVKIGGSLVGADFSATIYNSNKGWFPSTTTDLGVSTTAFGGGIQVTFDDDPCESYTSHGEDMFVSMGIGKYLGVSYNPELTRGSANVGLSLGLPVSFSTSAENFAKKLGESIGNFFK